MRRTKTMNQYYTINKMFINKAEISKKAKIVYKTVYKPTLSFDYESWIITYGEKSKIQAAEIKYLRRVKGVTKIDQLRCADVRQELEIGQFKNSTIKTIDLVKEDKSSIYGNRNHKTKEGEEMESMCKARNNQKRQNTGKSKGNKE